MSKKAIATMDSSGHMRVFDLSDPVKAKKLLQKVFSSLGVWDDEAVKEAVKDFEWHNIEFFLTESGFPQHGNNLIVDIEDKIDIES